MAEGTLTFENLTKVLDEYGKQAELGYRGRLNRGKKNASYKLADSVKYFVRQNGIAYEVGLNLEDYWRYVEYGRRPGKFPPPSAILDWIKVKPVLPRPDAHGRIPTQKSLAFLIGRKIADEGIKPTPIMAQTTEELNRHYVPLIREALAKDIGDNLSIILKTKY